jgi:hypothetical protein
MKVLDLCCAEGHAFEGWFASETDFQAQLVEQLIECPICGAKSLTRRPSAPRLNLSGATDSAKLPAPVRSVGPQGPAVAAAPAERGHAVGLPTPDLQAMWLHAVREVMKQTVDVGDRFPEEARRIHYGEAEARGIRGHATPQERAALADEGIEVMPLPVPVALRGPVQ